MEKQKNITGLLPKYFKAIGLGLIFLAFVPMIIMKTKDVALHTASKEWYRLLTMNVFILGLVFIAWARDKFEDEMTIALRLKTMGFAFGFGVLHVIITPFTDLLLSMPATDVSGPSLVVSMLLFYLLMYYVQKTAKR